MELMVFLGAGQVLGCVWDERCFQHGKDSSACWASGLHQELQGTEPGQLLQRPKGHPGPQGTVLSLRWGDDPGGLLLPGDGHQLGTTEQLTWASLSFFPSPLPSYLSHQTVPLSPDKFLQLYLYQCSAHLLVGQRANG